MGREHACVARSSSLSSLLRSYNQCAERKRMGTPMGEHVCAVRSSFPCCGQQPRRRRLGAEICWHSMMCRGAQWPARVLCCGATIRALSAGILALEGPRTFCAVRRSSLKSLCCGATVKRWAQAYWHSVARVGFCCCGAVGVKQRGPRIFMRFGELVSPLLLSNNSCVASMEADWPLALTSRFSWFCCGARREY